MHIPKGRDQKEVRRRQRAVTLLNRAGRRGEIQRQPCEVCGAAEVDAHHDDYDKPLEVRWLCRRHHWQEHRPTTTIRPVGIGTGLSAEEVARLRAHCEEIGLSVYALLRQLVQEYMRGVK